MRSSDIIHATSVPFLFTISSISPAQPSTLLVITLLFSLLILQEKSRRLIWGGGGKDEGTEGDREGERERYERDW